MRILFYHANHFLAQAFAAFCRYKIQKTDCIDAWIVGCPQGGMADTVVICIEKK